MGLRKKQNTLSKRFTDEFSFALFAEGLRAFSDYQSWRDVNDLKKAIASFEEAIRQFPQDRIHYYYIGLIRLEQASALPELGPAPEPGGDADAQAAVDAYRARSGALRQNRRLLTTDAVKAFEKYQRDRSRGDDLWLYFWSDYNRAACYVHQLQPDGYLCARGILSKYLDEVIHIPYQIPDRQDVRSVSMDAVEAGGRLLAQSHPSAGLVEHAMRTLTVGLLHPKTSKPPSQVVSGGEGESSLEPIASLPSERQTFLLRVKSLFMLTRVRPLREPFSLLSRAYLGLEPIETVRQAVWSLSDEIVSAQTKGPKKERISEQSRAELESDLLNQVGHLNCARALDAFPEEDRKGASAQAEFRGGNNFTVFSELMRGTKSDPDAQSKAQGFLQQAANSFEESLAKQSGWIPALKNLREVYFLLGRDEDASKIKLPVLVPPGLEMPAKPKPALDPILTWLTTYMD